MSSSEKEIFAAALALSVKVKVKLVERLLDSIAPIDRAAIDAVWAIEIERRLKDYNDGEAHTVPASQVLKRRT